MNASPASHPTGPTGATQPAVPALAERCATTADGTLSKLHDLASPERPDDDAHGSAPPPLGRLQWTLILQRLRETPQVYDFQIRLLHLVSWPSLTEWPEADQPLAARVCALLARRPTTGALLPVLLGLAEAQVFPLIEALRLAGHVQAGAQQPPAPDPATAAARPAAPPPHGPLWQFWQHRPFHD